MAAGLLSALDFLLNILVILIIFQWIMSLLVAFNVINTSNQTLRMFVVALNRMVEPLFRPIRRIMPDFGGIDFSPMVVLLIIKVLQIIIQHTLADMRF